MTMGAIDRPALGRLERVRRGRGIAPTFGDSIAALGVVSPVVIAWVLTRGGDASPDLLPVLFAAAAGCTVGLAWRRAPAVAWIASIAAMFCVAAVPIGVARGADPASVGVGRWLTWAVPAGLAALVTLWIAAGYATRPERRLDPLAIPVAFGILAWFALSVVVTIVAVIAGEREDPAFTWVDVASLPIAWFRPFVAILVGLGAMADVQAGMARARLRLPAAPPWELGAATIRELVPGQAAAEETRAAAERVRLAGDLHASVVPSLRRAIAAAEEAADPAAVLRHLRAADLELERLMAERWPIVLQTFGLVAALEDLAERLETDGSPPIAIDVERNEGRPPEPVERAAWRFAQVALDNAIRHAAAGSIVMRTAIDPRSVRIVVADDGLGFDAAAERRPGARGLADLETVAAAIGGSVRVDSRPGEGTSAQIDWTRR